MINVKYPHPKFRIKKVENKELIFDSVRKSWIELTDEEWVRQNFIQYLVQVMNYPILKIAVEKEIKLGELKKRFDILVYDKNHKPWMLIECKAPTINLDENVLQQILRYNISVPAIFLIITNGDSCYGWEKLENSLQEISNLPEWK
ncbi:MAG: type I restriction enzyme HsdR N-terminal domain-containing protein [Chitinophagaceae bacterium]|nr:MAG: type I restriction enzyme HsdR N-terminal domain-containing protein [Chitinophagaceae bacterium]